MYICSSFKCRMKVRIEVTHIHFIASIAQHTVFKNTLLDSEGIIRDLFVTVFKMFVFYSRTSIIM